MERSAKARRMRFAPPDIKRGFRSRRARRLVLLVVALLAAAVPAQARRSVADNPGDFDYFLLTLSIAPSFCALSPANQAKPQCQVLTEADFRATPLTVHGLWPNRSGVSVNLQPQDCEGPPLGRLPDSVCADLQRYMPGGPGLERYEWRKHGTCSGLSPEAYFATLATLARYANETIGAAMREGGMLGRPMRIAELLAAVEARERALASAIVVDCRQPRGGGEALVREIRVVLSKDLQPMAAADVGLGQNSGCPRGTGLVPDVSR
jgi:ribonuclease T2